MSSWQCARRPTYVHITAYCSLVHVVTNADIDQQNSDRTTSQKATISPQDRIVLLVNAVQHGRRPDTGINVRSVHITANR